MAKPWTSEDKQRATTELTRLYVKENLTIGEIAKKIGVSEGGVYDRLRRLGIRTLRLKKQRCNNVRQDIVIPQQSGDLAEFIGAMLGDGNLTPTQVVMTIGKKDRYVEHIQKLMITVFHVEPKTLVSPKGHVSVYIGSTKLVRWLLDMGLAFHKVHAQVVVPKWIFNYPEYMKRALRGLWDTDGSVYKLRYGAQLSFRNRSIPLLRDVRRMLVELGYHPSVVTGYSVYLTRQEELLRFANEIGFGNLKHADRINSLIT